MPDIMKSLYKNLRETEGAIGNLLIKLTTSCQHDIFDRSCFIKMGILIFLLSYGLFFTSAKCKIKREWDSESKQPLPFFRRQVEEIYDDNSVENKPDDQRNKLIAFLIKNVKEVFKDTDINLLNEFAESLEPTTTENLLYNASLGVATYMEDSQTETISVTDNNVDLSENLTIYPLPFLVGVPDRTTIKKFNKVTKRDKLPASRDLVFLGASTNKLIDDNTLGLNNVTQSMVHLEELSTLYHVRADDPPSTPESKRSCIHCNNVKVPECASPKNKL